MEPETTIVIRTKNEEQWLGSVLNKIFSQTYKNFEVIIVDSGSSDDTLKIAQKFSVKILIIQAEKFSYPYALNFGIRNSSVKKYIVIISGHSIPISETWLQDGLENFKQDKNLMGVFGPLRPLPDTSFWDKFFMDFKIFFDRIFGGSERRIIRKAGMGVLGFTNAIIRKDLWEKHNFDETYGAGGEDGEWSRYWFGRGYLVVKDEKFAVFHSHNLNLFGWYRQWQYWKSLWHPQSFHRLAFRKDRTHSD